MILNMLKAQMYVKEFEKRALLLEDIIKPTRKIWKVMLLFAG